MYVKVVGKMLRWTVGQYMSDFKIDNITILAPNSYLVINNELMLPIFGTSGGFSPGGSS
jgi:hypothetical protein